MDSDLISCMLVANDMRTYGIFMFLYYLDYFTVRLQVLMGQTFTRRTTHQFCSPCFFISVYIVLRLILYSYLATSDL